MNTAVSLSFGQRLYRQGTAMLAGRGLRRYAWVNRLNALIRRRLRRRDVEVLGHRMILDQNDSLELSWNGIYEPLETRVAQSLIRPGGVIVDIGANIGYYALLFARGVGANGRVFAFEPEPENFSILKQNIQRNRYSNVTLENLAVTNADRELRLYVNAENRGDHRVYDSSAEAQRSILTKAVSLDSYFKGAFPRISLLKMDIQGAEGLALAGMTRLLQNAPPASILMEFWPLAMRNARSSAARALETLMAHGYRLEVIDERRDETRPTSSEELLSSFTEERGNQTNLLARR